MGRDQEIRIATTQWLMELLDIQHPFKIEWDWGGFTIIGPHPETFDQSLEAFWGNIHDDCCMIRTHSEAQCIGIRGFNSIQWYRNGDSTTEKRYDYADPAFPDNLLSDLDHLQGHVLMLREAAKDEGRFLEV